MPTTQHIQSRGARRRTPLSNLLISIGAAATAVVAIAIAPVHEGTSILRTNPAAAASGAASQRPYTYGWPVAPFNEQHPVRGNFADPRTSFDGPPTLRGLLTSGGNFSFHQGIDISAPDGTAVYPVMDGVVRTVTKEWVQVDSDNGHAFQYWHVGARVRVADHVEAGTTVLGRILHGAEHVHLTELQNGLPVNPLAAGHIGPYTDTSTPEVTSISFRASDTGPQLLPDCLHGRVELVAAAADTQTMLAPGIWRALPVSPAKVTFRIERIIPKPAHIVIPETVARDVTERLPHSGILWSTYARGTHMNMPNFGTHRYWRQPGVYLFKLTPAPFDTERLHDGIYRITVTATDTAGNHSSSAQIFSVHNAKNWMKG
jgi:murein DD-endopeptidase MepM/ murein hydrolase activator NlpD